MKFGAADFVSIDFIDVVFKKEELFLYQGGKSDYPPSSFLSLILFGGQPTDFWKIL